MNRQRLNAFSAHCKKHRENKAKTSRLSIKNHPSWFACGLASLFQMQLKHSRICALRKRNCPLACSLEPLSSTRHWVKDHMNAKMILAALALSLSIAACAKKDEAPAADTAPAATETAPAAEPAPAETPPADQAPADATPAPADSGSATPPADAPKQ